MEAIIGRNEEIREMQSLLESSKPEFLAVYGRRRVGKTYLIRNTFRQHIVFQMTGFADATTAEQLSNYWSALKAVSPTIKYDAPPTNWMQAFEWLREYLQSIKGRKKIIFLDELPWIDTPRSKFIQALGHFWNAWASDQNDIILVVCGSAASWMINKLINDRGGLHNRVTRRIRLDPFTLKETEAFLRHKHIEYDRYQTIQLYMSLGGIPYYLNELKSGRSVSQEIDRLCFSPKGSLVGEYNNLYRSLFRHADTHIAIVEALAKKNKGLTRDEIIMQSGLSNGGYITKVLAELEESGFITIVYPFGKRVKNALYRLTDQFTLFHLKFMQDRRGRGEGAWLSRLDSPSWRAWSGYAFENVCFQHIYQLKKALGISGIYTETSSWQSRDEGAQIDLLIDRRDHVISVCEIKFSKDPYVITKGYKAELEKKLSAFRMETGTRKTVFLEFVTTMGLVSNQHALGLVQNAVTMDALFE